MESNPTSVRASNSRLCTLSGHNAPIKNDSPSARTIPTIEVLSDFHIRSVSPSAAARASAMLGPSRGAMTMAPMTTATLSFSNPMATTMVDSTTKIT